MSSMVRTRTAARLIDHEVLRSEPTLASHLRRHGPLPVPTAYSADWSHRFLAEIEGSGLTGRGGAGFPTVRKLRLAAQRGQRPTLLVNAMEGEPASEKDRLLVSTVPHLVLDGAILAATALNAGKIVICTPRGAPELAQPFVRALRERAQARHDGVAIEMRDLPSRYVGGEESALAAAVAGGLGLPAYRPDKSRPLSLGRTSALVHNVETLAHVALVARYGSEWFREVGSAEAPGTCLVTISGGVEHPGVVEVATGTPTREIVEMAHPSAPLQALLVGGYGGTWVRAADLDASYDPSGLRALGASMGAGILVALPSGSCGLGETARIARFMASESAGQCGPCLFGLPSIADDLCSITAGSGGTNTLDRLLVRCGMVAGRGACRHPDGVVRLVRSALDVFSADVSSHIRGVPCPGSRRPHAFVARLPHQNTEIML